MEGKARLETFGDSGTYGKAKLVAREDGATEVVVKVKGLESGSDLAANNPVPVQILSS